MILELFFTCFHWMTYWEKYEKKMCIDPTLGCITYFVIRILNETIEDTSITFYFTVNHVLQVFGPNKMYE
jgi:hypothetical protein